MSDIAVWLEKLGLGKYQSVFAENDIDFEVLLELTEQELEKLGLSLGHRKKLLKAIAALSNDKTPSCFRSLMTSCRQQMTSAAAAV